MSKSRIAKKVLRRLVPFAILAYFFPKFLAVYVCFGLLDVMRNEQLRFETVERYFCSNGVFTWLLSPFNLLMDLFTLPFRNKGVYRIEDLPLAYQAEIRRVIETAHRRNLVGELEKKLADEKRAMVFFKWYGGNVETSLAIPEYHERYEYIRTIGVSIFNKKQSTDKHFGPLRTTLRVLYNINDTRDENVFIRVGPHENHWRESKLFIFDDTLEHQSFNESEQVRYCLFIDILRPSLVPALMSAMVTTIRTLASRANFVFYRYWTFLRT